MYRFTYRTMSNSTQVQTVFASAREERKWNRLSEMMSGFHEWFKQEFNTLYELSDGSFSSRGMSLHRYLDSARTMNHHLTMHHTIEERHLFPILAEKMPQFSKNGDGAHILSHSGIHDGLLNLEKLVEKWTEAPSAYSPTEMRECLDGFREILFHHLDEEVADLRGENLVKYMTLADLEKIHI